MFSIYIYIGCHFQKPNPPEAATDKTLAFQDHSGGILDEVTFPKIKKSWKSTFQVFQSQDSAKLGAIDSYGISAYSPNTLAPFLIANLVFPILAVFGTAAPELGQASPRPQGRIHDGPGQRPCLPALADPKARPGCDQWGSCVIEHTPFWWSK